MTWYINRCLPEASVPVLWCVRYFMCDRAL